MRKLLLLLLLVTGLSYSYAAEKPKKPLTDSMEVIVFTNSEFEYFILNPDSAHCPGDFSFMEIKPGSAFANGCPSYCIPADFALTCTTWANRPVVKIHVVNDLCQKRRGCGADCN